MDKDTKFCLINIGISLEIIGNFLQTLNPGETVELVELRAAVDELLNTLEKGK